MPKPSFNILYLDTGVADRLTDIILNKEFFDKANVKIYDCISPRNLSKLDAKIDKTILDSYGIDDYIDVYVKDDRFNAYIRSIDNRNPTIILPSNTGIPTSLLEIDANIPDVFIEKDIGIFSKSVLDAYLNVCKASGIYNGGSGIFQYYIDHTWPTDEGQSIEYRLSVKNDHDYLCMCREHGVEIPEIYSRDLELLKKWYTRNPEKDLAATRNLSPSMFNYDDFNNIFI